MKKSKLVKLSLLLVITILVLSCTNTVYAASDKSKVTIRPPSDWELNNPGVVYGWGGFPPGADTPLYRLLLNQFWLELPPSGEYEISIKEQELSDGRALLTVTISLKDTPFWLSVWPDSPMNPATQMFENGKIIVYKEVSKFYIPFPGAPIPNLFDILWDDFVFSSGVGHGIGIFTNWAEGFGFTPGAKGMAFVNQRCLVHAASQNGYQGALEYAYPVEIVDVRQIG